MSQKKPKKTKKTKNSSQDFDNLFAELKLEYIDTFHEKLEEIYAHWQTKKRESLTMEFHKIKGTGTTYGIPSISQVAHLLESLCEADSQKLGISILLATHLFKKVCLFERQNVQYVLEQDPSFQFLQNTVRDEESA